MSVELVLHNKRLLIEAMRRMSYLTDNRVMFDAHHNHARFKFCFTNLATFTSQTHIL